MGQINDLVSVSVPLSSLSLNGGMKAFQFNNGLCSSNQCFVQRSYTKHLFLTSDVFFLLQASLITQPITKKNPLWLIVYFQKNKILFKK